MILIVGLGPAGLDRVDATTRLRLLDPAVAVVVRTLAHPAAADLARQRRVQACDDLYEEAADFDEVYRGIAARVVARAAAGPVAYAVPGSALVGERAVPLIREAAAAAGIAVEVAAGESFLGLVLERAGVDPVERGLQVLDGRSLPDPLLLHLPTVIAQIDTPAVLYDVRDALLRVLPPEAPVTFLADLGGPEERVEGITLEDLSGAHAGLRSSLFLDPTPPGWAGLVQTMARLRRDCPWDRSQTHHSLARHLIEEAYETVAALEALPPEAPAGDPDYPGYVEAEEELGDLLLQVVFHSTLAAEAGAFGVEEVAEGIRRKLVRRHPHVFGEVQADTAEAVLANWEQLKREEKGRESLLDGVPDVLPPCRGPTNCRAGRRPWGSTGPVSRALSPRSAKNWKRCWPRTPAGARRSGTCSSPSSTWPGTCGSTRSRPCAGPPGASSGGSRPWRPPAASPGSASRRWTAAGRRPRRPKAARGSLGARSDPTVAPGEPC